MDISAHPSHPDRSGARRLYASAARHAYQALLEELAPTGRPVLLPAYVGWSPREGSGLFDPVRATGIGHGFYPLDDHLRVDVAALEALLDERAPAALVLVHWFGFPEPATLRVAELCRARDVILVEDCCHCLGARLGDRLLGRMGDYAMASLHKVLSAPAGGYLEANGDRSLPASLPPGTEIEARDLAVLAGTDLDRAARRRRANYQDLRAQVADVPGVRPLHDELPDGAVPLNLPLLVLEADRYEVYKAMRARGVGVVALYHTLVEALGAEAFPRAFRLSERILNLPTHQELGEAELHRVAQALREAMAELPAPPAPGKEAAPAQDVAPRAGEA